jgi:hypothetical protein
VKPSPAARSWRRWMPRVVGAAVLGAAIGCSDASPAASTAPMRDCPRAIWAKPSQAGADLRIVGSWDGWQEPGLFLPARADGWHTARVRVPEGEYGYLISENGVKRIDGFNPLTTFRSEEEVSLLLVPACDAPEIRIDDLQSVPSGSSVDTAGSGAGEGATTIRATVLRGQSGALLAPSSVRLVPDGAESTAASLAATVRADAATGELAITVSSLARGKHACGWSPRRKGVASSNPSTSGSNRARALGTTASSTKSSWIAFARPTVVPWRRRALRVRGPGARSTGCATSWRRARSRRWG